MIDLHVHTSASDGQYTAAEIVHKAAEKKISVLGITDHDTVGGLEMGRAAAKECGITLVPGVELSINFPTGEFHLLGLGLKTISPSFQQILDNVVENRHRRNSEIVEKMRADGVDITIEEMYAEFPNTILGRPHFAAMLQKKGIVRHRQQAFDRFLAHGRPWYVKKIGTNLDEAIVAIRESGGAPVIAHPMSLFLSWGKLPDALKDFYDRGVVGLEAFHPGARVTECLRLEELAGKIGYFVTAASDFHGEKIRADRKLGHTCGDKKIEDRFWTENLKPWLDAH
ncbi:MAG: PHP domain-containing protein [Treponema sp.]|nr:PHP domain-containing protein [Treponema sp.]